MLCVYCKQETGFKTKDICKDHVYMKQRAPQPLTDQEKLAMAKWEREHDPKFLKSPDSIDHHPSVRMPRGFNPDGR